jgi:2-alkenal reductase
VTNEHVIQGSSQVEVTFSDGSIKSAEIIGEDPHSDLAVIHVEGLPADSLPLPLADIELVAVGQTVVAIGNPFGLGGTLTRGIVSALGRSIPALTSFSIPQSIQTDAPINPGNSGGPLLNLKGEVIGVNAQIETSDGQRVNSGVGFAIPASIVKRVIPELIANGKFDWPWIGVTGGTVFPALVKAMNLPVEKGAYIVEVYPDTPAEDADLRGYASEITVDGRSVPIGGDIITAIDGNLVVTFEDILSPDIERSNQASR